MFSLALIGVLRRAAVEPFSALRGERATVVGVTPWTAGVTPSRDLAGFATGVRVASLLRSRRGERKRASRTSESFED